MDEGDMDELVRLHDLYLNYGEGVRPHFEETLRNPDSVALKCVIGGKIAGFAIYVKGVFLSGGHEDICASICEIAPREQIWTGDALLVLPEYRRKGLDGEMIRKANKEIWKKGGRYALYELWVHPDGQVPARHTPDVYAKKTKLGEYKDFYINFDHYGYFCPICKGECHCSAQLYLCELEEGA